MSELAVYEAAPVARVGAPGSEEFDSWIIVAQDVIRLSNVIFDTPFVPDGLRGSAPAVAAAILAGRELGLAPLTSLANIHVIKGKPALSAVLMRALVQAQGHQWADGDVTDTRAVVRGRRKGEAEWTEVVFTADQAKRAGIELGKYPADKLYARATSRLARRKFADVIAGMPYSADELEDGDDTHTEPAPAEAAKPAQRTAQRRTAPPGRDAGKSGQHPVSPAPDGDAGSRERLDRPAASQPPLPGEDELPARQPRIVGIIHQHFKRLGFEDDERDQRLVATAAIAGVEELASSSDLTEAQARTVADTLSRCKDRDALIALLASGDKPGDAGA